MSNKNSRIILEDRQSNFLYEKNKSKLNISFNRISFIFFIFVMIFIIYSIHLIHLGSRKVKFEVSNNLKKPINNIYRADIVDRNHKYLVKTVSSIDIGISTKKIIDKKKVVTKFKIYFSK